MLISEGSRDSVSVQNTIFLFDKTDIFCEAVAFDDAFRRLFQHTFSFFLDWQLTTCGARGMAGPTGNQCEKDYKANNNSHVLKAVTVIEDQPSFKGMQKWKVPSEGIYT